MAWTLTTTNDYKILPNREIVRLYDSDGLLSGTVNDAKRLMSDVEERDPSKGKYLATWCDWRLPAAQVSAAEVRPGFKVMDSAAMVYTVLAADPPGTYNGTWNLNTVQLRVFKDTVTIKLPTDYIDADTSPVTDHSQTITAQPAAIQEITTEYVEFQHKKGFRKTFYVWLLTNPTLPLGSLIIDQSGTTYVVSVVDSKNRLDELTRVTCIINP